MARSDYSDSSQLLTSTADILQALKRGICDEK